MEGRGGGGAGRVGLAEEEVLRCRERGLSGGACVEGTTSFQSVTVEPLPECCLFQLETSGSLAANR